MKSRTMNTTTLTSILAIASLTLAIMMINVESAAAADQGAFYVSKWGSQGTGDGQFDGPSGVAIDSAGYIYVADRGNHRIVRHSPYREADIQWGSYGTGDGQFNYPRGIALDSLGNVYVADEGNHRIQKFSSTGAFLQKWGSYGTGNGQFKHPFAIAVRSIYVYVVDTENHRVQKFQPTNYGVWFVGAWGTYGTGDGQFNLPRGIAMDGAGNVYVADTANHRIQKFDNSGNYLGQWGSYGSGNGQFNFPKGLAVDGNGAVYVTDMYNNRIQKFASTGSYIGKWGSQGTGDGQFNSPTYVAVGKGCTIVVSDTSNNRVQKFACDNSHYRAQWGGPGTSPGKFNFTTDSPNGIAVDSAGYVYVADVGNNRIQKLSPSGSPVWQLVKPGGGAGAAPGEFNHPLDVAVDGADNVYVADAFNFRIQKFTSDGVYVAEWPSLAYWPPMGITVDSADNVYVVSYTEVWKYTSSGAGGHLLLGPNYTDGQGISSPLKPSGVAVDIQGYYVNVYVASGYPGTKVVRFNSFGVYQWNATADAIALDGADCIYTVGRNWNLIQKYTSTGVALMQWGGSGTDNGHFNTPGGIAIDKNGNVYVVDIGNNRVQRFSTVP